MTKKQQINKLIIESAVYLAWMLFFLGLMFRMYCMYYEMTTHTHTIESFGC